jgi:hypothetical protein
MRQHEPTATGGAVAGAAPAQCADSTTLLPTEILT